MPAAYSVAEKRGAAIVDRVRLGRKGIAGLVQNQRRMDGKLAACAANGAHHDADGWLVGPRMHGQQLRGGVEKLLTALGLDVRLPADSHLCCGSAGTYSIVQPRLSYTLRNQKVDRLQALEPQLIVSANIGCITHLQSGTAIPVTHWIELVEHMLAAN